MAKWNSTTKISSASFKCGHCDNIVASGEGFYDSAGRYIYICPHCTNPTYIIGQRAQIPQPIPGNEVKNVPKLVSSLYNEARRCISAMAYTSSVLTCRKLLMNIAVSEGAAESKNFFFYVEYLAENGFVPPRGKVWVDHIRKKGNEATHEIALMTREDAEELVLFSEMLLKFIYEFPAQIPSART